MSANKHLKLKQTSLMPQVSMSSREIAELTGKNHADVLRDIRKMLAELSLGESNFAGSYFSEQNKEMPLFNLDREHSLCLVAGYSAVMRMAIIRRWQVLEGQGAIQSAELSKLEIIQMAHEAELARIGLARQVAQQNEILSSVAPKIAALERIGKAEGELILTLASKELQVGVRELTTYLLQKQWVYRQKGSKGHLLAYQAKINQGLLTHKTTTYESPDGREKHRDQVLITTKGLTKLAELFSQLRSQANA
jgi:Rha family phage regulatory protein